MPPISKITKRLFLTSEKFASNVPLLVKRQVKYVLTVMDTPLSSDITDQFLKNEIAYENVLFTETDVSLKRLQQILNSIAIKIDEHERKYPTVIHCVKGQNRSPAAVLYWLIFYKRMSFGDALHYLKERRIILINPSWLKKIKKMKQQHELMNGLKKETPDGT